MKSLSPSWSLRKTGLLHIVCGIFLLGITDSFSSAISSIFCRSALWMRQTVIRLAEYCLLKKLNTSYFKFLFDFGSTWRVLLVPVEKRLKGCFGFDVALSTYEYTVDDEWINPDNNKEYLICSPNITVFVFLMFALNYFNFCFYSFFMKDRANEEWNKPENFPFKLLQSQ